MIFVVFSGKKGCKIFTLNLIFRGLIFDFFLKFSQFISIVKRKANSSIEQQNVIRILLRVGECSSDSYIGRDHSFQENYKICSGSSLISRDLIFDLLSSVHLLEGKASSTIEQQNCKSHEKLDRFLILNVDLNFQISQRKKIIFY